MSETLRHEQRGHSPDGRTTATAGEDDDDEDTDVVDSSAVNVDWFQREMR